MNQKKTDRTRGVNSQYASPRAPKNRAATKPALAAGLLLILVGLITGCAGQQAAQGTEAAAATQPTLQPAPSATPASATNIPQPESVATQQPPAADTPPPDPGAAQIALEQIASGFTAPVGLAAAGDGSGRLFVIEKAGVIRIIQNGEVLAQPFLDIRRRVGSRSSEQGLLGLAFDPGYAANGFFFVYYTDRRGDTVVARFSVSADPNTADPDGEAIVLTAAQPAANHNGGHLAFGPDGYLYIGLGDGGGAGDTYGNGQNGQTFLGKLLRIDVNALPYSIPADNPFVGNAAFVAETWAYGLRNPWRFSFDRASGDLYIADVGQNIYEEVNVQPADSHGGENYGWPIMEGLHCFSTANCATDGLALPVAEYDHTQGCSVTGGYVYRGQAYPALQGIYLFGDYCSGTIWGMAQAADGTWQVAELLRSGLSITSFGEDEAGEVYVVAMNGGIYRIVGNP